MTNEPEIIGAGDLTATLHLGDALDRLKTLPDGSVHCCVTSPPYWGLRDYGVEGQIGLEGTLDEFIGKLVAVFREVRRVLRGDGTCWINMGDGYGGAGGGPQGANGQMAGRGVTDARRSTRGMTDNSGIKPKDLIGQPWMLAFALRADGWYLRQDIIWHKPNPMPESVTDRCTKAHEYIFLLSKSSSYYYDADAIKEPVSGTAHARGDGVNPKSKLTTPAGWATGEGPHNSVEHNTKEKRDVERAFSARRKSTPRPRQNESFSAAVKFLVEKRNKRSVWTVVTKGYPEAHFATFPPKLIEPCILAGCPKGGTVLDPFNGSGTTGQVALEHGCNYIGIELNPEYLALTRKRLEPLLAQRRIFT